MIAFKLPLALYEQYMRINHHDAPLAEEEKLNANIRAMEAEMNQASKHNVDLQVEGGTAGLGMAPEPPPFAAQTGELQEDY